MKSDMVTKSTNGCPKLIYTSCLRKLCGGFIRVLLFEIMNTITRVWRGSSVYKSTSCFSKEVEFSSIHIMLLTAICNPSSRASNMPAFYKHLTHMCILTGTHTYK